MEKYNKGVGQTPTSIISSPASVSPFIMLSCRASDESRTSLPSVIFFTPFSFEYAPKPLPISSAVSNVRSLPKTPLTSYSLKIPAEIINQLLIHQLIHPSTHSHINPLTFSPFRNHHQYAQYHPLQDIPRSVLLLYEVGQCRDFPTCVLLKAGYMCSH